MMKIVGPLVFVLGGLIAISAAAKLSPAKIAGEEATEKHSIWPDTIPVFAMGAVVSAVGLGLWWSVVLNERAEARMVGQPGADEDAQSPSQLVAAVQQPLGTLAGEISDLDSREICQRVQMLIDSAVAPLAESRARFIDRFGLANGSEILNATAFGERMLNRVWSAASDGHVDEARSSFQEAVAAFAQAEETLTRFSAAQA